METTSIKIKEQVLIGDINFRIKVFLISFFMIYFGTSVIDAYFLIYLPLLYFSILEISVNLLTIIQYGIYSTLLFLPISGLIFDKYIRRGHLTLVSLICILIAISFFCFSFYSGNLVIYILFSIIYFISQALLRGCMSNFYFKALSKMPEKKFQNSFLVVANSSSITAYLFIVIIFNIVIRNFYDLSEWNRFLIIGSIIVLTIMLGPIFLKFTNLKEFFNNRAFDKEIRKAQKENLNHLKTASFNKKIFIPMLLIYLTGFLSSSDQLYSYTFSSWILIEFGDNNFKIFTTLYSTFQILILIGYLVFQRLLNNKLKSLETKFISFYEREKIYNTFRKQILILSTLSFCILYLTFTIVDFFPFIICYAIFNFIAGIYNISLTNFNIDFSQRLKNKAFFYLLTGTSISLAQFIFKPLGILLTKTLKVEGLMMITCALTLISIIPLLYSKLPTQES